MKDCAIAVTGLGLITPLGCGVELNWERIRRGDSIASEPVNQGAWASGAGGAPSDLPEELAAYVRSAPFVNPNGHHRLFPMALAAAREALNMAGLSAGDLKGLRVGCAISVSKPIVAFTKQNEPIDFLEQYFPDAVGRSVMRELGVSGPCVNVIAACATGVHSILAGSRWLEEDLCDVVLCGSAESSLHPLIISGFKQMGVLSRQPRPFDRDRDGFMMGEGAGVLILERKERALARFASVIAELEGCAVGTDVSQPTLFDRTGDSIVSVIERALRGAGLAAGDIDYLNAHGTGTVMNDAIEAKAIRKVFARAAEPATALVAGRQGTQSTAGVTFPERRLMVSSTKGSTGHLLGASGSVEAAIACLALRDQCAPPSAALDHPDEALSEGIRFVTSQGPAQGQTRFQSQVQLQNINRAASLSFGFGGPIGVVLFKK